RLPIPADPRRVEPEPAATGCVLPWRALDAPVMRQVKRAPAAIIEPGGLGSGGITQGEAPPRIHGEPLPLRGGGRGQQGKAEEECGANPGHGRAHCSTRKPYAGRVTRLPRCFREVSRSRRPSSSMLVTVNRTASGRGFTSTTMPPRRKAMTSEGALV